MKRNEAGGSVFLSFQQDISLILVVELCALFKTIKGLNIIEHNTTTSKVPLRLFHP